MPHEYKRYSIGIRIAALTLYDAGVIGARFESYRRRNGRRSIEWPNVYGVAEGG